MVVMVAELTKKEEKFWEDFSIRSSNLSEFVCPVCEGKTRLYESSGTYYIACFNCDVYSKLIIKFSEFKEIE